MGGAESSGRREAPRAPGACEAPDRLDDLRAVGDAGEAGGLLGPASVAWRVHDHPAALVGGVRALLVEALHPRAMAAVDRFSDFREDPWGRLRRTSEFVLTITYGTGAEAQAAAAGVRRVHERVRGVDPHSGKRYRADEPELLAWVHNVTVESLLLAYLAYASPLGAEEADRYVAEMRVMGALLGLDGSRLPATRAGLERWILGVDGLVATPAAREALRLVFAPPLPIMLRPAWATLCAGAIALLPDWARRAYGLPPLGPLVTPVWLSTVVLTSVARLVRPVPPAIAAARARTSQPPRGNPRSPLGPPWVAFRAAG